MARLEEIPLALGYVKRAQTELDIARSCLSRDNNFYHLLEIHLKAIMLLIDLLEDAKRKQN